MSARAIASGMRFRSAVYALLRRVPRGQVVTYGQLAAMVHHPGAARAVGGAMRRCPDGVPWHRVVNSQGRISRRRVASGMLTQRIRLEQEGVRLRRGRVPLAKYQWDSARGGVNSLRAPRERESARGGVNGLRAPRERGVTGGPGRPPRR